MQFSGYISKHLYSRIAGKEDEIIQTPLNDDEVRALNIFKVPYEKTINDNGYPIYILDTKDLKAVFCN